jgi:hypothetical protein
MGALISLPARLLNALLPFTNPSTPLIQDLIHTAILVGTLYFAPQIAETYRAHTNQHEPSTHTGHEAAGENQAVEERLIPVDETFIPQDDGEDAVEENAQPPPPNQPVQDGPAWQNQPDAFAEDAAAQPGPANERPRPTLANRAIGPKKAKSLARKDQRRAYHEFHRQEAEMRRLREAEGKEEKEAELAIERARRAEVVRQIQEREREERERRKEEEKREQEEERNRRERVVELVRMGVEKRGAVDMVDVGWKEGKDGLWVERLIRASGMLSQLAKEAESVDHGGEKSHVMITGGGWIVRVDEKIMQGVYAEAVQFAQMTEGKVSFDKFGTLLEKAVTARAKA